jgi:hypothetical protein
MEVERMGLTGFKPKRTESEEGENGKEAAKTCTSGRNNHADET